MAQEQLMSFPNLFWFSAGLGAEVVFLGLGVSPMGMDWGTQIAEGIGLIEPFNASAAGVPTVAPVVETAAVSTAAVAPTPPPGMSSTGLETLEF